MSLVPHLTQSVYPRRGSGGGGGHGGGEDGGHGSADDAGHGKGSKGSTEDVPVSGSTDGRSQAVAYGAGGSTPRTIPEGEPFVGRTSGGGTRGQVYGTSEYGSGYPGLPAGSVAGRDFPFVFWPVVCRSPGYGAPYLYSPEYGTPWNTSRPGGPLAEIVFTSSTSNNTFYVISDNSTVTSLITSISKNCTGDGALSRTPSPFNATAYEPQPEQAVEYYRASSVVLLLDGYNNTIALTPTGGSANATAVALPDWVDRALLTCLNDTIGEAVPVFSGAHARMQVPSIGWIIIGWVLVWRSMLSS